MELDRCKKFKIKYYIFFCGKYIRITDMREKYERT